MSTCRGPGIGARIVLRRYPRQSHVCRSFHILRVVLAQSRDAGEADRSRNAKRYPRFAGPRYW